METHGIDVMWWMTAIELPALGGLFWLIWRTKQDVEKTIESMRRQCDTGVSQMRETLAAYKLEVAQSYASITYLKEVEKRLTDHLLRIEGKLETSTLRKGDLR